ncbi:UNVERIFIED_CONTAM: UNC93-like protein 3 [Sesamum calycinum]|uniref:UNC93-like protein 3 n=1 Tax=Sesamum calycinum TaxID=2727403 RepID=A0AAW2NXC4_9LAMI
MATDEESPLVVEENHPQTQPLNHKRDVHILCWAFLLIFLAYGAVQNLESTINTEGDLGTISLGILYVSFALFSVFASLVVRKLGSKNALVLGTTGYWLFTAANLKPSWYTMVPTSLYMGFAASIIWVGQGTYLTSAAHSHANDHNLHEGTVIGKFNGEFWGMFACHQLVGNLMTLAVLRDEKHDFRYNSYVLLEAEYTKEIVKPALGERGVGGAMAIYGIFDALSSLAAGRLTSGLDNHNNSIRRSFNPADRTALASGKLQTSKVIFLAAFAFFFSVSGGLLASLLPLVIGALWGIGDGVLNTQLSALLGILFKHDLEGAFAQLKLWQSVSIAVVFFVSTSISLQTMVVILLVALCISVAGFLFLTLKVEKAFSYRAA